MLNKNFVPKKPFEGFKWKWACLQCTEGINDPVILLGVLFRMRKLEQMGLKYSSPEFAEELKELSKDTEDSIGVDLAQRTGERNLIRNSGQYWRAVNLIPAGNHSGKIELTEFGRKVADREISQTEFAAITIQTFQLPNPQIQSKEECEEWVRHKIAFHPLLLILNILVELNKRGQGYLTTNELARIIVPLSGCHAELQDYVNFILWYRDDLISLDAWPNCISGANDIRFVREYLLFLKNYGYIEKTDGDSRINERYDINFYLIENVEELLRNANKSSSQNQIIKNVQNFANEFERNRIQKINKSYRPYQAQFRKSVLQMCKRCVITNVTMPEILEAAHIKPVKYNGDYTAANGFAMRTDIHILFDTGHLRISTEGVVELSPRARLDYGATIPPRIVIPDFIDLEFIRWRWDNYNGI